MNKWLRLAVLPLFAILFATPVSAQVLEGTLSLSDSVVAQFATIYLPELRQGTMSDQDGHYKLDEIPAGKWTVHNEGQIAKTNEERRLRVYWYSRGR